ACGGSGQARPSASAAGSQRAAASGRAAGSASAAASAAANPGANGYAMVTAVPLPNGIDTPVAMAYDSSAAAVYVLSPISGLTVVSTRSKSVVAGIAVSGGSGIAFDGDRVYVPISGASELAVVDKSNWSAHQVPTNESLAGGIWAAGDRLYLTAASGDVLAYSLGEDPQSQSSLSPGISSSTGALAGGKTLLLASKQQVEAIDLSSGQAQSSQQLEGNVTALAADDRTGDTWAATDAQHLYVLDGSLKPSETLDAPFSSALALDPGMRTMYAFGAGGFEAYDTNTPKPSAK